MFFTTYFTVQRTHYIALVLLSIASLTLYGQDKCGTPLVKHNQTIQTQFTEGVFKDDFPYEDSLVEVPIVFHIIRPSNGIGGISETALLQELDTTNYFYANAGIRFVMCHAIQYIDEDRYTGLLAPIEETTLIRDYMQERLINVFVSDSVFIEDTRVCGFAYFPGGFNTMYLDQGCILQGGFVMAHEMGHFFNLEHTHGNSNQWLSDELVDGSNCEKAGDYICDTPADPNLSTGVDNSCQYIGNATDLKGDFFMPDPSNIMSYAPFECVNKFTQGQYKRIRQSLFKHQRINFKCTPAGEIPIKTQFTRIGPNPVKSWIELEYDLHQTGNVSIELYGLLGNQTRLLDAFQSEQKGKAQYINRSDYTIGQGIYILVLKVNDEIFDAKKILFLPE